MQLITLYTQAALEGVAVGFISSFLNTSLVVYAFIITATAAFAIAVFSILTDASYINAFRESKSITFFFVVHSNRLT